MKVAVIGARWFKALGLVRAFVAGLPYAATIVSGGASGVACGHFGRDARGVTVDGQTFDGDDADLLRKCGRAGKVEQNA